MVMARPLPVGYQECLNDNRHESTRRTIAVEYTTELTDDEFDKLLAWLHLDHPRCGGGFESMEG